MLQNANKMDNPAVRNVMIRKFDRGASNDVADLLAVEEPLEIRLEYGPTGQRKHKNLSVTMRTPGSDEDLACGFLFTEGLVRTAGDVVAVRCFANIATVVLSPDLVVDLQKLERHFYTTSSCGVCGKTSIEAVQTVSSPMPLAGASLAVTPEIIDSLPAALRRAQETFDATGGLHAAAIFDPEGRLIALREDVGRHNALDKLIGHFLRHGVLPLDRHILLLSGRASFELLQKAAVAGIRIVCAVGAPSSLAVETAETFGIALIGFLREGRFNQYSSIPVQQPA